MRYPSQFSKLFQQRVLAVLALIAHEDKVRGRLHNLVMVGEVGGVVLKSYGAILSLTHWRASLKPLASEA